MRPKKPTKTWSVGLPVATAERAREYCYKRGMFLGAFIAKVVEAELDYLERREAREKTNADSPIPH